jgi:hypothetical protein
MSDKGDKANWDDIATLEAIANQCIYKGKEVAKARAILKSVYGNNTEYNDDEVCSTDNEEEEKKVIKPF